MFLTELIYFRFTYHTISGLNPGKDYVFRIYAENVYGRSDPSEPTALVTTKCKFRCLRDQLEIV